MIRAFFAFVCLTFAVLAQQSQAQTLSVSTVTRPPFSYVEDGSDVGFSMDLLQALAESLDWDYTINRVETFGEMLGSVQAGTSDLAIANISITAQRETLMDFSQPIFEAGLQIMVPSDAARPPVAGASAFVQRAFYCHRACLCHPSGRRNADVVL